MLKALRQLRSELLARNPWWDYRKDRYERPDRSEGDYYYVHTPGSVMILPVNENGKLILVKQYRYLNRRESIEFIGGGIKGEQGALESAREELQEEAGIIAGELIPIGSFNPMNGVTDEICNIYVAQSLKSTHTRPEVSEEFELVELSYTELCDLIQDGTVWDGMTLAACALFEQRKDELLLKRIE
jgi:ADP-ribose pyrophosphatase